MTRTLSLAALALAALATAPALASSGRAGPGAMLQSLTFAQIDADTDGGITLGEWRTFVTSRAEALRAEAISGRVARLIEGDTDGDGLLSAEELTARIGTLADERRAQMAERRGERRAEGRHEGRGQRSYRHGSEGRTSMGMGRHEAAMEPGERIVRMFQRFDRDGDGRITEAEFDTAKARMQERLERRSR
jgi:Ca2+-binding EF-hand superfamily protein